MAKVLVVYFSRSGNTRSAAERVARGLGADVEEIVESHDRKGPLGYLRSAFEATFFRRPSIAPGAHDPASYELVVIGTPVWNASLASPVRTYLAANRERIGRFAISSRAAARGWRAYIDKPRRSSDAPRAWRRRSPTTIESMVETR